MTKLLALGAALCVAVACAPALAEQRLANVSQGTDMALALTPDGESLVVDLLGRLWLLPAAGGGATQLTPDDESARHPRIGPDGRYTVYQRLVDGQWDLWLLELETLRRRPLLATAYNEREPDFADDGRSVVFASDRTGHYCLWSVDVESGVLTQLTEEPGDASFPTMSDRGEIAYVKSEGARWSLKVLTAQGAAVELLTTDARLQAPSWRPGGDVLIFNEIRGNGGSGAASSELRMLVLSAEPVVKTLTRAEDVFTARVAWASPAEYYYAADGQIWRRGIGQVSRASVHLFAAVMVDSRSPAPVDEPLDPAGPHPVLGVTGRSASSDERMRVFTALGDLWVVDGRGDPVRLTDDEFVDVDASVSPEGDFAVFASDRSGYMDLWRVALPGGVLTQLTNRPEKAYHPAVSPDGERVAFLETTGIGIWGSAALRVLDLADPAAIRTLADGLLAAAYPRWAADGMISVEARSTASSTSRDAAVTIDVATGRKTISAGSGPGAAAASTVAAAVGAADAAAAQAAEAAAGFDAGAELPELEWQAAAPPEPYVVQVGRLFDGIRSDYLRHVDVHIEGQRIVAIVGRGMRPLPATVVDARDATVIPGLIDVHAHHSQVLGERLGRAWLAYGVTTVRELADDVAAAVERGESWASGRRLGPRLIVSPGASAGDTPAAEPAREALPTPVPVRGYAGLTVASAMFRPDAGPLLLLPAWRPGEHRPAAVVLRTSPLNLIYEDVFSTLVSSGTVIASDIAAVSGAGPAWTALTAQRLFQRVYSPEERIGISDRGDATDAARVLQNNLVRLVRAGGRIAVGTEAPATPYGLGLHVELELLAEAGIPPDQVLRIATASNAMALGLERQVGTLEAGKLADFVIVSGNPLADVSHALNVTAVVKGGVLIEQQRLSGQP